MSLAPPTDDPPHLCSCEQVVRDAAAARRRLAELDAITPLETIVLPSGRSLRVKREDVSKVHSFKWRGAGNAIAAMAEQGKALPVVTASAGNHAQGVALAAARFGVSATIYMPVSAPKIKQRQIHRLGGERVRIVLEGDTYDDAAAAARRHADKTGDEYVHAFNNPAVIAGQATIGCELVEQLRAPTPLRGNTSPVGRVYLPIGGGGLAAGVGSVLRAHWPNVELVGVEAHGQRSMHAALAARAPVDIGRVDPFCDGTAVRRVGDLTHRLCARLLDRVIAVSNDEVCAAVEFMWEARRCIPEPSGALGLAAALREDLTAPPPLADDHRPALTILTGANIELATISAIAKPAAS